MKAVLLILALVCLFLFVPLGVVLAGVWALWVWIDFSAARHNATVDFKAAVEVARADFALVLEATHNPKLAEELLRARAHQRAGTAEASERYRNKPPTQTREESATVEPIAKASSAPTWYGLAKEAERARTCLHGRRGVCPLCAA
jgi:hypothetical protein